MNLCNITKLAVVLDRHCFFSHIWFMKLVCLNVSNCWTFITIKHLVRVMSSELIAKNEPMEGKLIKEFLLASKESSLPTQEQLPEQTSQPISKAVDFDELFLLHEPVVDHPVLQSAESNGVISPSYDVQFSTFTSNSNVDSTVETPTDQPRKCISPIQWDRASECDNAQDAIHVDAQENEFALEDEQARTLRISSTHSGLIESTKELTNEVPKEFDELFKNTKFFLIKSNNHENIDIAKSESAWATITSNESRLNKAFFDYNNVILIFSVKESGKFQGYARLCSSSDPRTHVDWVLPPHMSSTLLSSPFKLDWISK